MKENLRSADQMVNIILKDPARLDAIKANPSKELAKVADEAKQEVPAYVNDKTVYRMVVGALGLLALLSAVGVIILVAIGKTAPDMLVALGSAAVGALAGLLAPSPTGK
jgi:hypothetical protein